MVPNSLNRGTTIVPNALTMGIGISNWIVFNLDRYIEVPGSISQCEAWVKAKCSKLASLTEVDSFLHTEIVNCLVVYFLYYMTAHFTQ